jgi:hypothetical protein
MWRKTVTINLAVGPVVSLIAGVLILIVPRLLNYIVAIYLILIGLIGIFGWNGTHLRPTALDNGPAQTAPALITVAASVPPGMDLRASRCTAKGCD